jgi:hypothetical protein
MYEYRIEKIIPEKIARSHEEKLLEEGITEKDLKEFTKESKLWSDEAYFELGQNKAFKLETENAFGDWIVLKFSYGDPFLWNLKTLRKQSINIFELYVIIEEFQINKYNSLNIKDGEDVVIKEGKKYIDGHFVEDLKPLEKINYNFEE